PALAGGKLNVASVQKFEKVARLAPDELRWRSARWGAFLCALTEKMTPKERQALIKTTELTKHDIDAWQKLEARARKLESALKSARIKKPSQVYHIVSPANPDEVLFLLSRSSLKPVQERLRNYFQKYLPMIQEITPDEWASVDGKPGTPTYAKARDEFITPRLDRRPKKVEPAPAPPPPPEPVAVRRGR